jgi:hypothetical protein
VIAASTSAWARRALAEQPFVDVCLDRAEREFGRQRDPRLVSAALTAARDGAN